MAIKVSNVTVIDDSRNIQNIGIITATTINATSFVGNGSGLTGAGSTVSDDTSTNSTFYPLFTQTTSGTVTESRVSTTKLSFNPSTGILNATKFVGDGSGLTGAGSTVINDNTTNSTYYPLFTQTTSGTVTESRVSTTKLSFNPSTGILNATKFVGDGSGLTGAGSTVVDDTSTNSTFYPLFTQTTSGTVTESRVSTTKLSFNPSTGRLTATSLGGNLANTLTLNTSGTGLSGSTTFNNSSIATFTVTSNATSANTASTIVARDGSGNFSAGTITASLSGNSTTATTLQNTRTINGVNFNGSANIEVNPSTGAYSNGFGARTIQSGGSASGGSNGDIYYIY